MTRRHQLGLLSILVLVSAAHAQTTGGRPAGMRRLPSPRLASDRIYESMLGVPLTFVTHAPLDTGRLFIVEQRGGILVMNLATQTVNATPFLDIDGIVIDTGTERGLLGLAFHPDYANNGRFYVNYSRNGDGDTVIAEYTVSANPDVANVGSARIVMTIDQPQANGNGGWIGFGPMDGYLYVSTGDGGSYCDDGDGHTAGTGNAQDITGNLLGKILRIDPLAAVPYGTLPTTRSWA